MESVSIRIRNDEEDGLHPEYFEFKLVNTLRNCHRDTIWKINLKTDGGIIQSINVISLDSRKKTKKSCSSEQLIKRIFSIMREAGWTRPLTELEIVHEEMLDKGDA